MVLTKKDSIISYNRQCQQFFCNEVDSGPGYDLFKDLRANKNSLLISCRPGKKKRKILPNAGCVHIYIYTSYIDLFRKIPFPKASRFMLVFQSVSRW